MTSQSHFSLLLTLAKMTQKITTEFKEKGQIRKVKMPYLKEKITQFEYKEGNIARQWTYEQIFKEIRVPKSSVYSILSKLSAAGWVESTMRRPSCGRPSEKEKQRFGGKPTRVFMENVP
jgi:hypothetical protein